MTKARRLLIWIGLLGLPAFLIIHFTPRNSQAAAQYQLYLPGIGKNCAPLPFLTSDSAHFGFARTRATIDNYDVAQLHAGWYINYNFTPDPIPTAGLWHMPLVSTKDYNQPSYNWDALRAAVKANSCKLWLIGNEPDRTGIQDNWPPETYATIYHDFYTFIKNVDPRAKIGIAGVVQATPIRLTYLDRVLAEYQRLYGKKIPVDVWNTHLMILRECNFSTDPSICWGASIPPGLDDISQGMMWEPTDNDNINLLRTQLFAFREWMANNGEQNKPLIVSEYGILMSDVWGFNDARINTFMYASFDLFLTAKDSTLGYPADQNRLIQAWAWYSLDDKEFDGQEGFNGSLFVPISGDILSGLPAGSLTEVGKAYGQYTQTIR